MTTNYDLIGLIGLFLVAAIVVLYRQWRKKQRIKKILKDVTSRIKDPYTAEIINQMADEL